MGDTIRTGGGSGGLAHLFGGHAPQAVPGRGAAAARVFHVLSLESLHSLKEKDRATSSAPPPYVRPPFPGDALVQRGAVTTFQRRGAEGVARLPL